MTDERGVTIRSAAGIQASSVGIGDILLRSKYRLVQDSSLNVSPIVSVRLPSGDPENLQGLGDTIITPGVALSRPLGLFEAHGSFGIDANADKVERSRARYAAGTTFQPWDRVAMPVDVIGSSSFVDDEFDIRAPAGRVFPEFSGLEELVKRRTSAKLVAFVPRSDVVDLAVGIKLNVFRTLVSYASAIVPLTHDGLRADSSGGDPLYRGRVELLAP